MNDHAPDGNDTDSRPDDALRWTEERLRLALDAGRTGVWEWDIVTGRITWSDRVHEFYGMRPGEFDGTLETFARHLHPDDAGRATEAIRASVEGGAEYRIEYRIVRKGGDVRWIYTTGTVYRDPGGRPLRMLGATSDVTDRRRAEEVLRQSEERYRVLATATADVVYRMSADWALMQPLDGRSLVPSTPDPVRGWMEQNLPASEHARVRDAIDRAIRDKQTFEMEHRVNRPDGTVGWTFSRAVPILDAAGGIVEWFGTARDVTRQKQAQEELARVTAESDRRKRLYETVLSATPDFVYVFSLDHRVLYANDALIAMWGRGPEGAIGKTFLEIGYEPWHAAMHDREIDQVRATMQPVRGEVPFHGTLGRRVYEYIFVPVLGTDGEVEAVAGTTRDVTDRKQAEEAVRRGEERFRGLMEQAPFSVQIFAPDGRTLSVNRAWEELWGLTLDQLADYNLFSDPQLEAKGVAPLLRRAAAGEAVAIPAVRYDPEETIPGRTRHADPDRWVSAVAYPLKDAAGRVREVVLVHDDITERVRAEAAVRASEAEFRATFERAGVGKAQADPATGRLTRVNPKLCELLGYTADELVGMAIRDLTHPDDRAAGDERFRALVAGEVDQYAVEKRYLRKGGEAVWVRVTATVVRAPDGRPVRASAIIEDVTARIQAQEALREADRRKDAFIAMLAHELRNPLGPIGNAVQVLGASRDAATVERVREMIGRQVGHLSRIVSDLLDVSRVTRGRIDLRRERLDLARLAFVVAGDEAAAFDAAGVKLEVAVPDVPVWVSGDRTRLTQVIANLLANAVKFTDRGGTVRVGVRAADGDAVLTVSDTGVGIEPGLLPHLFQAFTQADTTLDRSRGGLGLGLSMVKGLAELHGGTVRAESGGPGAGATFTVRLPRIDEPAALTSAAAPSGHGAGARRLRVLVVEDNRDAADSLQMLLELTGCEVRVAYTGPDGVAAAVEMVPDLVICDIGLPGISGYEVARRIRAAFRGGKPVLVALTGYGDEGDRRQAKEAGFDRHFTKPVDPAALGQLLVS